MNKLIKVLFTMLMMLSLTSPVYAENDKNYDALVDSFENLVEFEKKENIDVVKSLKDMINDFEEALKDENLQDFQIIQYNEQIEYLESSITTIKNLKSQYNKYGNYEEMKQQFNSGKTNDIDIIVNMLPGSNSFVCDGYRLEANAIISYFNNQNYKLSAELLARAFNNTVYLSTYIPNTANTSQIKNTSWFKTAKTYTLPGSAAFSSGDLFYSIHNFDYSFWYEWGLKYMKITDNYDYHLSAAAEYPAGLANNVMYGAQYYGCLVPFKTTIHLSTN